MGRARFTEIHLSITMYIAANKAGRERRRAYGTQGRKEDSSCT